MNGLIIKVLSISIAVVTVVYLIIYKGNTMITKIFSVCIIAAMVISVSYTHLTLPTILRV